MLIHLNYVVHNITTTEKCITMHEFKFSVVRIIVTVTSHKFTESLTSFKWIGELETTRQQRKIVKIQVKYFLKIFNWSIRSKKYNVSVSNNNKQSKINLYFLTVHCVLIKRLIAILIDVTSCSV